MTPDFPGTLLEPWHGGYAEAKADRSTSPEEPGRRYIYVLARGSLLFGQSHAFRADGPPTFGEVVVESLEGEAATTTFVLQTGRWSDEEELETGS